MNEGMHIMIDRSIEPEALRRPTLDFFRHHGVWALGVRLFRRLTFRLKAACISLAFGLPIVLLSLSFWQAQQEALETVRKERAGVRLMAQAQPLLLSLLEVRNATRALLGGHQPAEADLASGRRRVDEALARLAQGSREDLAALGLAPRLQALQAAWAQTAQAPQGVDEQGRTVFGPVAAAVVELLQGIGDNSRLVLDAELDGFYLVDALVLNLPRLADDLGQLWGWSTFGLAKGFYTPEQLRRYAVWDAGVQSGLQAVRSDLQRAARARPSLKQAVPVEALDAVAAYRSEVGDPTRLLGTRTAEQAYRQGHAALQQALGLADQGLRALDGLLAEREAHLLTLRLWLGVATLFCLALAAYLFHCFFLVMDGGLKELRRHMLAMTAGDLRTRPEPWGCDEAARLMHTLHDMQASLCHIVAGVRDGSGAILQASADMAQGAVELARRTEQSAASLQTSASAMEQIAVTVRQTAEHAGDAAGMATGNADLAQQGSAQVQRLRHSIAGIEQASGRMADITGLIDSLAFQTNILALNAAVEAARAGEEGRGFAVVAAEVRALAQRSALASKEIRSLISANLERVQAGGEQVGEVEATMARIARSAAAMNQLLAEIASGAAQQREGVAQVGASVQELDGLTQRNVALVERSVASAQALQQESGELVAGVERFKLPEGELLAA